MARTAAALPDALAVALMADKDARNMVDPVVSPWPAWTTLEAASRAAGGDGQGPGAPGGQGLDGLGG